MTEPIRAWAIKLKKHGINLVTVRRTPEDAWERIENSLSISRTQLETMGYSAVQVEIREVGE